MQELAEISDTFPGQTISNSLFNKTLQSEGAIIAQIAFRRPSLELSAIPSLSSSIPMEDCLLLSIGDGLDGKAGRLHGGFTSLVLDQITGHCAHWYKTESLPPATATMTVDFKAPVITPNLLLVRAWILECVGRKVWVKGVIEDGKGGVYAEGKALFITARPKI